MTKAVAIENHEGLRASLEGSFTTDVETAAAVWGVGMNTAYRLVREGTIPARRLGARRWRVLTSPLLEMLEARP